MLQCQPLTASSSPLYSRFLETYAASFPPNERRSEAAQAAALADPRYRLDAWTDGSRFVGFMGWWDFGEFRYIEHVAVAAEARSSGYGKRIMRRWLDSADSPVYLEIEEPVDETTRRRQNFYQSLGFVDNNRTHVQPPYQGGGEGVRMRVLSRPAPLGREEYERFLALLFGEVWAHLQAGEAERTEGA